MHDDEIDAFARIVERQIKRNRERLDELPDFKYGRQLRLAQDDNDAVVNMEELLKQAKTVNDEPRNERSH